jgi:uncharacterized protein involved in outer membrane biogenesis
MAKKIGIVVLVIVILFVVLGLAKNMIIKTAVSGGVHAATGLKLQIKGLRVGVFNSLIDIKDLKLFNPPDFTDKVMADVPQIYIDYDLGAFFKNKVHLEEMKLDLKELVVVKNEKGELNLDSLKVVKKTKEEKASKEKEAKKEKKAPQIQIDDLSLKIGKVIYKDYSKGGSPQVKEFNVNIDEQYKDITDPNALVSLIVVQALAKTTIAKLANFDIGSLQSQAMGKVTEALKGMEGAPIEKTVDELKKLLPFGK